MGESNEEERDEDDEKEDDEVSEDEEEEEAGSPGLAYLQKSNLEVQVITALYSGLSGFTVYLLGG